MKKTKQFILLFSLISLITFTAGGDKHKTSAETNGGPKPYSYRAIGKDSEIKIHSFYLTMRDSVKIAVSIYLPTKLKEGEKLPVIFHQTRYWRSMDLRWPLTMFKSKFVDAYSRMIKKLVLNDYAVVNIDVRGTGASMGYQKSPFSKEQIKDAEEIINWIVQQKWCNGEIGMLGASYTGMQAEFSLANNHPNIKALMALYTGFDFYDEMIFPGGVYHKKFVKKYEELCGMLDRNEFLIGSRLENFFVKGVTPVEHQKRLLKTAVAEHKKNFKIYQQTQTVNYRNDESPDNTVLSMDELSLHSYLDAINKSNTPICLLTGWFDGCFALGSSRLFNNLKGSQNKLIIGPWDHGSLYNCSPFLQESSTFDKVAQTMKFFDYHLKHKQNGLDKEPPVYYYTMGEERWQTSNSWPPVNTQTKSFYLSDKHTLALKNESTGVTYDTYIADTSAGTGNNTRSESLVFQLTSSNMYDNRTERDKKLICYNSPTLSENIEITGHPSITLYTDVSNSDVAFFVYLEDIDESGNAHYLTEGEFRAIHRNGACNLGYKDMVTPYTYKSNDACQLKTTETNKVEFDLLPISYLFKKGHSIRVAISCADNDHYKNITPNGTEVKIQRNSIYASKIDLPTPTSSPSN